MQVSHFQYALRFTLDPATYDARKAQQLLAFCRQGQIDEVVFFINPEELNQGHVTKIRAAQWLTAIRQAAQPLQAAGIAISLNPWTTIMHSDRGRQVPAQLGFDTMVNYQGQQSESMACPADQRWRDYLSARYAQFAAIHPVRLWLEDDFRRFKSPPFRLGCFCPRHMAIFSQAIGHPVSREEFVAGLLKPGKVNPYRKIYLDNARQEMIAVAKQIEQAVHAVSPQTDLALMTSFPDWHCIEARDWHGLLEALSGARAPTLRPHLPAYNEIAPLKYARVFDQYTRTTAAFAGSHAATYPELENYMYSPYVKSSAFTQFQLETTALIGAKGIMLNLFDMMGNGVDPDYHYASMLAASKPLLNLFSQQRLQLAHQQGVKVLMSQDSSYTIQTTQSKVAQLVPHETDWLSLLSTFGIATVAQPYTRGQQFKGQVIAVSGQLFHNLTDAEIQHLITDNVTLLDGPAIEILLTRRLGDLINVTTGKWHSPRTGYQSYEQLDGQTISQVENPRLTMLSHTGAYLQLTYDQAKPVSIISNVYNEYAEKLGPMLAVANQRTLLLPLSQHEKYGWEAQYNQYRELILKQLLQKMQPVAMLQGMPVCKLISSQQTRYQLDFWISNFSLDPVSKIRFSLAKGQIAPRQITLTYRHETEARQVILPCQKTATGYEVDFSLAPLATVHLVG